ncbi:MAG: HdeD family acid-resistance protein [Gaiellaceae bacterium]
MSNMFQQAEQMVGTQVTKLRWALGLSGALSIALGVVIIVWPGISLFSLVLVFGAFAFARGILQLGAAIGGGVSYGRGWLALYGVAGIAVGVIVFLDTGMSALALLYVIGAYAIVLGLIAFGGAFVLPLDGGDSLLLAFTGVISVLFGVVVFAKPGDGALVLLALIAAYALIVGVSELGVAIGGKRLFASAAKRAFVPTKAQTSHS